MPPAAETKIKTKTTGKRKKQEIIKDKRGYEDIQSFQICVYAADISVPEADKSAVPRKMQVLSQLFLLLYGGIRQTRSYKRKHSVGVEAFKVQSLEPRRDRQGPRKGEL